MKEIKCTNVAELDDFELECAFLRNLDYELTAFNDGYIAHQGKILFVGMKADLPNCANDAETNCQLMDVAEILQMDITKNTDGTWLASSILKGVVIQSIGKTQRHAIMRATLKALNAGVIVRR